MTTTMNDRTNAMHHSQPHFGQRSVEIQAYGTLRLLPIALSVDARMESCQLLNQILANQHILHALYKKHHWQMRGITFDQLHGLLDRHADEQIAVIDLIAERIQMLGGVAIADPRHVAELTTIERAPDGVEAVPAMLSRLLAAHEAIIMQVRDAIERTNRSNDAGTNDLLVGNLLRLHERHVWFLAEHLVDTPIIRVDVPPLGVGEAQTGV